MPPPLVADAVPTWHSMAWEEVARRLETDPVRGLTARQALARPAPARLEAVSSWRLALALFARQWKGSVIVILCAAAAGFWLIGHRNDAAGIAFSVIFAVTLGFLTDYRSQKALETLKSLNAPSASVIRDGIMVELESGLLVSGDVVVLRGGARVPADGRVFAASELTVQESALTGESEPRAKTPAAVEAAAPLAERTGMVYAGTTVVAGAGRMIVAGTGLETELGRIGKLVQGYHKEETPLEVQVEALGRRLGLLVVGLCLAATVLGLALGQDLWEMVETGFMLAIAAIPEGLPAVNTVALAGGVRRMVLARAVVRRLAAVEVLGSVDVICTDKTGTLTENVMRAAAVVLPGRRLDVTGNGYVPDAAFKDGSTTVDPRGEKDLQKLLWIGALCNNAVLESHDGWHIHGSPTEGALLTLAVEGGVDLENERAAHERLRENAFTSARKRMSVVVRDRAGVRWALAKGAVGVLSAACTSVGTEGEPFGPDARAEVMREAARLGAQGLRVLGLAYRRLDGSADGDGESGLVWAGMVGLLDPPRRTAAQTVMALARAGIRTIMVTGDQKDTASAIAARLGIAPQDVFSRVSPQDKLKLVESLKSRGHVVAMTGDGINDAPALKAADIGVAMGSGASDVAKEAADLVVTDAEYETLAVAVEEGRRVYANLRRATSFLVLCSLGNIALMSGAIALRLPLPMTALQLLWLNLVIHVFPAIALAVSANTRRFMEEPPRSRDAALLGWGEIGAVAFRGSVVALASLIVFRLELGAGVEPARTAALTSLGLGLLLQVFPALSTEGLRENVRSAGAAVWLALAAGLSILAAMLYLPPLRAILATVPLSARGWGPPCLSAAGSFILLASWDRVRRVGREDRAKAR